MIKRSVGASPFIEDLPLPVHRFLDDTKRLTNQRILFLLLDLHRKCGKFGRAPDLVCEKLLAEISDQPLYLRRGAEKKVVLLQAKNQLREADQVCPQMVRPDIIVLTHRSITSEMVGAQRRFRQPPARKKIKRREAPASRCSSPFVPNEGCNIDADFHPLVRLPKEDKGYDGSVSAFRVRVTPAEINPDQRETKPRLSLTLQMPRMPRLEISVGSGHVLH